MGASLLTHPLDTIKVQYQAQSGFNKLGLVGIFTLIFQFTKYFFLYDK